MEFIKNNALTIALFALLVFFIMRNNSLQSTANEATFKAQREFIIEHQKMLLDSIKGVDKKLAVIQINTMADSISRFETLKKYENPYKNNLSHDRLLAIRDSLRKIAK